MGKMTPADMINAFNAGRSFINDKKDREREDEKWKYEKEDLEAKKKERERKEAARNAIHSFFGRNYTQPEQAQSSPVAQGITAATGTPEVAPGGHGRPQPTTGAPIQSTPGTSPMAAGTQVGAQAGPSPRGEFQLPDVDTARQQIMEAQVLAAQYPEYAEQMTSYTEALRGTLVSQAASNYQGDPMDDPTAYMRHMTQINAKLGKPMTVAEAKEAAAYVKKMEDEGFSDALKYAKLGDLEMANKAWDRGDLRGRLVNMKYSPIQLYGREVPNYSFDVVDETGKVIESHNTAELEAHAQTLQTQIELGQKQETHAADLKKKAADTRKVEADIDNVNSQIQDRVSDNYRDQFTIEEGSGDKYIVNKTNGEKIPLNIGAASGSSGTPRNGFGLSEPEMAARKKAAREIIKDTSYGAGRTMMSEVQKVDPKAWAFFELITGDGVDRGMETQHAADVGNYYAAMFLEEAEKQAGRGKKSDRTPLEIVKEAYTRDTGLSSGGPRKQPNRGDLDPMFSDSGSDSPPPKSKPKDSPVKKGLKASNPEDLAKMKETLTRLKETKNPTFGQTLRIQELEKKIAQREGGDMR